MSSRNARPVEQQYTIAEVAELLGYGRRTIERRIQEGAFDPEPWFDGRLVRISASAVNNFIERRRIKR